MTTLPTLNIIGAGKVGRTLARLWQERQVFCVGDVLNRSLDSSQQAVLAIGGGRAAASLGDMAPAQCWLLAVADDAIETCCQSLARTGLLDAGPQGKPIVFHCSGALSSHALASARDRGALTASVHPIRSFADAQELASLEGAWCGIEGDTGALETLSSGFEALGARMVAIQAEHKLVYHSAAVFACNYLVTLLDVAVQAYGRSGVPPDTALAMMESLVRGTVDNVFRLGPAQALTGPIARGDLATVRRQEHEVRQWNGEIGELYHQFVKLTMELAVRKR
ncbi:Rossmann-like and DUF2520 domain-containing protein [Noviherbaspirillum galbum]|uniref:DUF2520 domain-containing protein n=1 Tax=Noviherbaspirillum galbum TaxID=2709383 RepID=A0A6B3SGQ4_9BURK|nr:Rossmann-like and DUF2520 domain-containing protein [Noviherbaspirillum galbum]NEX59793.1 DUF2520 domain-containing protein [Noviherbaspirillum galbum]